MNALVLASTPLLVIALAVPPLAASAGTDECHTFPVNFVWTVVGIRDPPVGDYSGSAVWCESGLAWTCSFGIDASNWASIDMPAHGGYSVSGQWRGLAFTGGPNNTPVPNCDHAISFTGFLLLGGAGPVRGEGDCPSATC